MKKAFLKKAVELSQKSVDKGKFPAGAVIAKGNRIVCSAESSNYPHAHIHAEVTVIDEVMAKVNMQLYEYELYTSLSSCLMCLGKIYWSGIKKVYYVLSRKDVDTKLSYEGDHDFVEVVKNLNRKIEFIQDKTYFDEALKIYNSWTPK